MKTKRIVLLIVFVFTLLLSAFDLGAVRNSTGLEIPKLKKNDVLIRHTGFSLVYSEPDEQASQYDTLYIATGPVLKTKKPFKTIGTNQVSVPDYYYKVIMVYGKEPQAIGYLIPQFGYSKDFNDYACSVDQVEKVTGVDFFYSFKNILEKI